MLFRKNYLNKLFEISSIPISIIGAIFFALVVNILFLTCFFISQGSFDTFISGDGDGYLELAKNLANGNGFVRNTAEGYIFETFRTPGLPSLLAVFFLSGSGLVGYFFTLSILSSIIIPLCTWYIGSRLFSNIVGIISAWLITLEPLIYLHNWLLLTEIPYLIVFLIGVTTYIKYFKSKNYLTLAIVGILLAFSVYIRPGALLLIVVPTFTLAIYLFFYKFSQFLRLKFIVLIFFLVLTPWIMYIHSITSVYAVSGTGWRNVYTDYLASLRSINNETTFAVEKNKLKAFATETWGFSSTDINDPANSKILRDYSLAEIYNDIPLVIKLQSLLFISYFTHTDYFARLVRLDVITAPSTNRSSVTQLFLSRGLKSLPEIFSSLRSQYFMPILERVWSLSLFIFATVGFFSNYKNRIIWLIFLVLALGYLSSSAIGLGIEGRLRIPLLPFYLFLTSLGIITVYNIFYKNILVKYEKKN